jgi:hypothetical protein
MSRSKSAGDKAMFAAIMRIYIDVITILTMQARPRFHEPRCRQRI